MHAMQALSQLSYGPTRRRGTLPDGDQFVKKMNELRAQTARARLNRDNHSIGGVVGTRRGSKFWSIMIRFVVGSSFHCTNEHCLALVDCKSGFGFGQRVRDTPRKTSHHRSVPKARSIGL